MPEEEPYLVVMQGDGTEIRRIRERLVERGVRAELLADDCSGKT